LKATYSIVSCYTSQWEYLGKICQLRFNSWKLFRIFANENNTIDGINTLCGPVSPDDPDLKR